MAVRKNITSIFMAPTLKVPNEGFKHHGYINSFIRDEQRDVQYENWLKHPNKMYPHWSY